MDDLHKAIAKIIATAWADTSNTFQNELATTPDVRKFLKEKGLELPDFPDFAKDGKIQFVTNTENLRNIVIPERPKFTDEDMGLIIKLRQICATDCSCKACIGSQPDFLKTIVNKIFGGE